MTDVDRVANAIGAAALFVFACCGGMLAHMAREWWKRRSGAEKGDE